MATRPTAPGEQQQRQQHQRRKAKLLAQASGSAEGDERETRDETRKEERHTQYQRRLSLLHKSADASIRHPAHSCGSAVAVVW